MGNSECWPRLGKISHTGTGIISHFCTYSAPCILLCLHILAIDGGRVMVLNFYSYCYEGILRKINVSLNIRIRVYFTDIKIIVLLRRVGVSMVILRSILLIWVVFGQIIGLVQKLAADKVAPIPRVVSMSTSLAANFCTKP